jgi:hypothetical protein
MALATCIDSEHGQLIKVLLAEPRPCGNSKKQPYCALEIMVLIKHNATNYNS